MSITTSGGLISAAFIESIRTTWRRHFYAISSSIATPRAEEDLPREDGFTDLWAGLQVTFRMVREGVPELAILGYDGMLFEELAGGPGGRGWPKAGG